MKVGSLCGGLGTRLRRETEFRPKPLVQIGPHPILWHIMKLYAHHGFNEFVPCLGCGGHVLEEYFLSYQAMSSGVRWTRATAWCGSSRRLASTGARARSSSFV